MASFVFRVRAFVSVAVLGATFVATSAHADGPGAEVNETTGAAPSSSSASTGSTGSTGTEAAPVPAPYERSTPAEVSHWYGWQTLLVDGAAIAAGIGVGSSSASPGAGAAVFLGGYTLGAPIVHWAHGNAGRGFASLGLRIGAPLLGGYIGSLANHDSDDLAIGAGLGVLVGYVAAVTIDSAVLARETVAADEVESEDAPAPVETRSEERSMFKWTPSVTVPHGGGATAGISGTF